MTDLLLLTHPSSATPQLPSVSMQKNITKQGSLSNSLQHTMVNFVKVRPFNDSCLEELRSVFHEKYQGCRVDLENINNVTQHQGESRLMRLDVVIRNDVEGCVSKVGVFVKTLDDEDEGSKRSFNCQFTRFMAREVLFYTKLFPSIIKDNLCNKRLQQIIPKCFFANSDDFCVSVSTKIFGCCLPAIFCSKKKCVETGTIVLEDLSKKYNNIKNVDKNELLNKDHLESALTSLAHFHGASWRWVYKNKNLDDNFRKLETALHCDSWYLVFCFKTIFKMIRRMLMELMKNSGADQKLIEKVDNFLTDKAFKILDEVWCNKSKSDYETIIHGDYWSSNLLFRYNENGRPVDTFIVDFQHIGLGSPFRDILSLVYASTTSTFRAKHLDSLIKHYYQHFQKYRQYQNSISSSFDNFYHGFCKSRGFGFVWGLYIVSVGKYFHRKVYRNTIKYFSFVPRHQRKVCVE